MHPNPAFRKEAQNKSIAFVKERGFGMLTVNGPDGPLAAHVPFVMGDGDYLELHLVRSNPIARALDSDQPALLAISGPDGYVSPDWYEIGHDQVPTWNYVAVHIRGTLSKRSPDELRDHLDHLSASFEDRLDKTPWRTDKMPDDALNKMMRMIIPFRMTLDSVDSTWKLNQNKPPEARYRASAEIAKSPIGQELADLSRLMKEAD